MNCLVCGIEFESSRRDAKTCSPKCRKDLSRLKSVTDNVTLSEPIVTDNFEFKIATYDLNMEQPKRIATYKTRSEKYWYEVPLGAIPIIKKGWPEMPDYMNGRQYFLWWKNEFKVNEKNEPIIHNPFPVYENVKYVPMSSRMGV